MDVRTCAVDRLNFRNPNNFVGISDAFESQTILLPNLSSLSKIQTSLAFHCNSNSWKCQKMTLLLLQKGHFSDISVSMIKLVHMYSTLTNNNLNNSSFWCTPLRLDLCRIDKKNVRFTQPLFWHIFSAYALAAREQ